MPAPTPRPPAFASRSNAPRGRPWGWPWRPGARARLALVPALLAVLAAAPAARAELPAPLLQQLAEVGVPPDAVGLLVAPVAPGPRYLAHQVDRPLQPASTMKLVTTLVGLEQLGPAWRGRTRLLAAGDVIAGVLHGDLVLQGLGDMDLDADALRALLQRARLRGLSEVRGALVLDRSAFQPTRLDQGLQPFDEAPEFGYNVIPDALLVNDNLLRLDLFVDERGLQVMPLTPLAGVRVTHEMQLVEGDCSRWDEGWLPPQVRPPGPGRQLDVVLRGSWPARCERTLSLNVIDRNDYIGRLVRQLWTDLGGRWRGPVREGVAPPGARVLAERSSRPLSELVRAINKPSDNAFTRTLYLALGRESPGDPAEPTLQRAERAVRAWFRTRGIDETGLVLDNGSGLSRSERLTPAQLEAVVRAGLASRWAPEFLASLPIAGVDGTLRRRLTASAATGQARLKTGTLKNVVSLAGTMTDAAGQPLVVVAIFNHDNARPARLRPVADALVDWIARQRFERADRPAGPQGAGFR